MPELSFRTVDALGDPAEIDIALIWKAPAVLAQLSGLKAILALGAGVDQLDAAKLPKGVPLARLVDPTLTRSMVEYCRLAVLRHHRRFDEFERTRSTRQWRYAVPRAPESRSVGILGLGELGRAVALDLAAGGFRVSGWSRTPKRIEGIACHSGADGLARMLAGTEILINLLPLTAETANILNKQLFEAMPRGAAVINVGRGGHLVDADLIEALASGRIAAATLDVFRQEPLPEDHPFWAEPAILVTPHVASSGGPSTAAPQIVENIRRARAGEALLNAVDVGRGY
jgi:glyoxylate/hydroxypyruvate reductase A